MSSDHSLNLQPSLQIQKRQASQNSEKETSPISIRLKPYHEYNQNHNQSRSSNNNKNKETIPARLSHHLSEQQASSHDSLSSDQIDSIEKNSQQNSSQNPKQKMNKNKITPNSQQQRQQQLGQSQQQQQNHKQQPLMQQQRKQEQQQQRRSQEQQPQQQQQSELLQHKQESIKENDNNPKLQNMKENKNYPKKEQRNNNQSIRSENTSPVKQQQQRQQTESYQQSNIRDNSSSSVLSSENSERQQQQSSQLQKSNHPQKFTGTDVHNFSSKPQKEESPAPLKSSLKRSSASLRNSHSRQDSIPQSIDYSDVLEDLQLNMRNDFISAASSSSSFDNYDQDPSNIADDHNDNTTNSSPFNRTGSPQSFIFAYYPPFLNIFNRHTQNSSRRSSSKRSHQSKQSLVLSSKRQSNKSRNSETNGAGSSPQRKFSQERSADSQRKRSADRFTRDIARRTEKEINNSNLIHRKQFYIHDQSNEFLYMFSIEPNQILILKDNEAITSIKLSQICDLLLRTDKLICRSLESHTRFSPQTLSSVAKGNLSALKHVFTHYFNDASRKKALFEQLSISEHDQSPWFS